MPLRRLWLAALVLVLGIARTGTAQVQRPHLTIELVSEHAALVPGQTAWVGLRLEHDPHWHTYWMNPGDSGLETRLKWTLPQELLAGEIAWPAPERITLGGGLTNYGYSGEVLLPIPIEVSQKAAAGKTLPVTVNANWLVCQEECIPGNVQLSLDLPVTSGDPPADARWTKLFAAARAAQPKLAKWKAVIEPGANEIVVRITGDSLPAAKDIDFFPAQKSVFTTALPKLERKGKELILRAEKSSYFAQPAKLDLVLTSGEGESRRAWQVSAAFPGAASERTAATTVAPSVSAQIPPASSDGSTTLLAALLLGFGGGLLLNLMPCVFPILSLKALGLAQTAHHRHAARLHGLAYMAGVLTGFLALASTLMVFRAAGQEVGWGFQLSSPILVAGLAYLMLAMGLSLSGVYSMGARIMGLGGSLAQKEGASGAYFTGVLACIVATPCTAPFMATAIGFALGQSTPVALAIFSALGLGMAAPIVALSFMPALAQVLPRPGAWMERFKQAMAFPLYLTAVWLFWVLGRQVGGDALAMTLAGAVVLAAALWMAGLPGPQTFVSKTLYRAAIAVLLVAAVWPPISYQPQEQHDTSTATKEGTEPFTPERLAALRSEGRPVLVNMTAAWCITCLANDRVALSSSGVKEKLRSHDIAYLKGDWTNQDPAITKYLAEFGRNGVPLYVVYPQGGGQPEVLPQLLTPALVTAALQRAAQSSTSSVQLP